MNTFKSIYRIHPAGIAAFILVLAAVIMLSVFGLAIPKAHAQVVTGNLTGWAWSSTSQTDPTLGSGWISFNCSDDPGCSPSNPNQNYAVSEASGGILSGYAWSENLGWITFNSSQLTGCPSGTCGAYVLPSGAVSGWARACGAFSSKSSCNGSLDSNSGGWDGWIHLSNSPTYGPTQSNTGNCNITGYSWGSDAISWIKWNPANGGVNVIGSGCTNTSVTLTANPTNIIAGGSSQLTWTATGASSCSNITDNLDSNSITTGGATSGGPKTVSPNQTITYSITCNGKTGTATVTVTAGPLPDLVASATTLTPASVTTGTPITLSATITNIGTASTGKGFNNFFQVATAPGGGGTVTDLTPPVAIGSALAVNGSAPISTSYIFSSAGTYSVRACADKSNSADQFGTIVESNENNNCGDYTNAGIWTTVTVTTAPSNQPTSSLLASSDGGTTYATTATVVYGHSALLKWTSQNANTCSDISYSGGVTNIPTNGATQGTVTVTPTQSQTSYQITCTNNTSGLVYTSRATINTTGNSISAVGCTLPADGVSPCTVPVNYNYAGASSAEIEYSYQNSTAPNGSQAYNLQSISPNSSGSYNLSVYPESSAHLDGGPGAYTFYICPIGSTNCVGVYATSQPVQVLGSSAAAVGLTFTANPTQVALGSPTTLTWQGTGVNSCGAIMTNDNSYGYYRQIDTTSNSFDGGNSGLIFLGYPSTNGPTLGGDTTMREVLGSIYLQNPSTQARSTTFSFEASAYQGFTVGPIYVGPGDFYGNFTSTPTQLTFNGGQATAQANPGQIVTSDPVSFVTPSYPNNLIISTYLSPGGGFESSPWSQGGAVNASNLSKYEEFGSGNQAQNQTFIPDIGTNYTYSDIGLWTIQTADWGPGAISGSRNDSPTKNTIYTLTCNNNITGQSITKTVEVIVGSSAPDLVSSGVTPTTAIVGTPTTFSATITNQGNASTGMGFENFFQVATNPSGTGATDLTSVALSTLAASASAPISMSYTFSSAGTYYLRACADKSNSADPGVIAESNENNNCGDISNVGAWTPITVGTAPAPTVMLLANGSANPTLPTGGGNIVFTWTSNATSCGNYITGGSSNISTGGAANNTTGLPAVPVTSSTVFSLTCSGPGGSGTGQAVVNVTAGPSGSIINFSANPLTVQKGGTTDLTWSTSNMKTCQVSDPKDGNIPNGNTLQGTNVVSPPITQSTAFTLSCTDNNGTLYTRTVNVNISGIIIEI